VIGWSFRFDHTGRNFKVAILIGMRWLIIAVVLLALAVAYLVHKTSQLERTGEPGTHLLAAQTQ
jgi:hypothetical protein